MLFLRNLVVCIFIFKHWAEDFWIFVGFFGRFVKSVFRVSRGMFRGKLLGPAEIPILISDFEPKKMDSEKEFGIFLKTASYISRGTFGAFFEYVISRTFNFKSLNKNFLPPMERPWHGCKNGILRDQATVVGDFCLKVKKRIFLLIPSFKWPKMKVLVVFSDKFFQIAFCLTR